MPEFDILDKGGFDALSRSIGPEIKAPGRVDDDPVWPLAGNYIDGIPGDARKFKRGKSLRATIHAWLATRAEPRKMGAAIGAGDIDAAKPPATTFTAWLRAVFD